MTRLSPYASRLLAVLPHYGRMHVHRAAHHASLPTERLVTATHELVTLGLVEIEPGTTNVLALTDAGRDARLEAA